MAEAEPVPIFYQPDPEVPRWIMGKLERLERRGPCEYVIVGRTDDGRPAEGRIAPMSFQMRGI
jgi:hypothetical protein